MENQTPRFSRQEIKAWLEKGRARIGRWRKDHPRISLALLVTGGLGIVGVLFLFILSVLIYKGVLGPLPTYADLMGIQNNTASEVYSEDSTLLGKYYIENRVNADFEEISPNIINALVATEDARFFEHSGIDFKAWMRVMVKSVLLFDESSGGGSTLSQQLAKNLYPRREYWMMSLLVNKIREMFVARRLERIYTKEELLRLYLNTVPFSENIFGVKVAAQRFFNKSLDALKVEEAAVLVGMLKATSVYNPVRNPERAFQRRNTVINQMTRYGYLSEEERDSIKLLPVELEYYKEGHNTGLATYFREHLRLELEKILEDYKKPDGSDYNIYTDGLKIYTTLDARMQRYAEEAVNEHMPKVQKQFYKNWRRGIAWGNTRVVHRAMENSDRYQHLKTKGLSDEAIEEVFNTPVKMTVFSWENGEEEKEMTPLDSIKYYLTILNTGLLAIDPATGFVKAWVGGINHKYFQYDHIKARRQVGSTFKPIVYATALQGGMLPCEYTANRAVTYIQYDNWQPRNSNGEYGGVYSMEGALSHSVNSVTVEITMRAGVDSVRMLARAMGIESPVPEVPAISLGAVDASLVDMVRVYGTFANRGRRPEIHYLDRVENSEGEVIVEFERPDPRRFPLVLAPEYSDVMIRMMKSVVDSGTARRLRYEFGLYNDIAGKTGTTQNHSDGWFLGFTPNLVAGVWVGAEDPHVHFRTMGAGQGSNTALPIWGGFMKRLHQDPDFKKWRYAKFKPPADTMLALMKCPPYLEEMPILAGYEEDGRWNNYGKIGGFFDRLFGKKDQEDDREEGDTQISFNLPPRRSGESDFEYRRRIRKYLEREKEKEERREKRKEFWNNLLFGKEEKDNDQR